jgi:hypothetical protein
MMEKYEINVWKDAELLSKEVVQFETRELCYEYVLHKYHAPGSWTGSHQNINGVTLNRSPVGVRVTWSKLPGRIYKPKKLSVEEKKLQRELYNSITLDEIPELGHNEMLARVRKDYASKPNATGYDEFPSQKKTRTYIDGITGEKYTK